MKKKYRLRKHSPFGKEGDVFQYDPKGKKYHCNGNVILKKYLTYTEYFEEVTGKPRIIATMQHCYDTEYGSMYGAILEERFKTEEEAQAKLDLINHIYKFDMPEEEYFYLNPHENDWQIEPFEEYGHPAEYHGGIAMNYNTTEEDRAERLRLLKKVYTP